MADSLYICGFGTREDPFIERPPLPRAQFRLPPDVLMAGMVSTREYVELRIRIPLIPDSKDAPIVPNQTPTGILAFDLRLPPPPLVAPWTPLRRQIGGPSAAEQIAARREAREREARLAEELAAAEQEWQHYHDRHTDNPVAQAGFGIHRPEVEYDRVVCTECRESDFDDTIGVAWPCGTYQAMKDATDTQAPNDDPTHTEQNGP